MHKIRAGADFVITQVGFDIAKFEELTTFLDEQGITIPLLANVFIPTLPLARALAAGKIPGILMPEELVARMEVEAATGADKARLDRAALMVARLKQCGYQGVHLGGVKLPFKDIAYVLDRVEQLEQEGLPDTEEYDFPVPGTWYYFQHPLSEDKGKKTAQPLPQARLQARPGCISLVIPSSLQINMSPVGSLLAFACSLLRGNVASIPCFGLKRPLSARSITAKCVGNAPYFTLPFSVRNGIAPNG